MDTTEILDGCGAFSQPEPDLSYPSDEQEPGVVQVICVEDAVLSVL